MINLGLDSTTEKPKSINYCPTQISKVYSKEGLELSSFDVAELSSPNKIHVHIRTYVDFYGGYAEHGRYIALGLNDSGQCCVKLTPIKSLVDIDPFLHQKCNFLINNPGFDINESIFLTIAGPGWAQKKFQPENRYKIIWTMIESLGCHPDFEEWLKDVDEVWVPTNCDLYRFWNIKSIRKLIKMKLGIDTSMYYHHIKPIEIYNLKGRFVFGVLGSWNKRKGIKKIVRAFCKEFRSKENVSLLLVCKYGTRPYDGIKDGEEVKKEDKDKWDIKYEFQRYTQDIKDIPHVTLIDIPVHENIMPNVMKRFDCLVGFSMGESTWLPGLQAMAMKIPVIQLAGPNNGFVEYMNESNSFLCTNSKIVSADEELYKGTSEYYENQEFIDGDENELAAMMRRIYENRSNNEELYEKIERAHKMVLGEWTQFNSLASVARRLREIKDANKTLP